MNPGTMGQRIRTLAGAGLALAALTAPAPIVAQAAAGPGRPAVEAPTASGGRGRISITWRGAPIRDVLLAFAAYSGKSIVPGATVGGTVTADINDQPWDVALRSILSSLGLVAVEDEYGIIRVDDLRHAFEDEAVAPILTRVYPISFIPAEEVRATLAPLLSARGSISVSGSTNAVIVSDIARVHAMLGGVIRAP